MMTQEDLRESYAEAHRGNRADASAPHLDQELWEVMQYVAVHAGRIPAIHLLRLTDGPWVGSASLSSRCP